MFDIPISEEIGNRRAIRVDVSSILEVAEAVDRREDPRVLGLGGGVAVGVLRVGGVLLLTRTHFTEDIPYETHAFVGVSFDLAAAHQRDALLLALLGVQRLFAAQDAGLERGHASELAIYKY